MNVRVFLFALLLAPAALAQGFAGLGTDAPGFAVPDPDRELVFPDDHGAHPDFRIEWWYVTANLENAAGDPMGVQWTLFRSATGPEDGPGWLSSQVWMGHAAATSKDAHRWAERFARGGSGAAGALPDPFVAWIDDWAMEAQAGAPNRLRLSASGEEFSYALDLIDTGPLVLQGQAGYSVKSAGGEASHYYSRPFLEVSGELVLDGTAHQVTGTAWLDREWSSQPLSGDQSGWDWVGLDLEDGRKLMAARVVSDAGDYHFGTVIAPDGETTVLGPGEVEVVPNGADVSVRVPGAGLDLTVSRVNPDAFVGGVFQYWEGPVLVSGSHAGRGYLEQTGGRGN